MEEVAWRSRPPCALWSRLVRIQEYCLIKYAVFKKRQVVNNWHNPRHCVVNPWRSIQQLKLCSFMFGRGTPRQAERHGPDVLLAYKEVLVNNCVSCRQYGTKLSPHWNVFEPFPNLSPIFSGHKAQFQSSLSPERNIWDFSCSTAELGGNSLQVYYERPLPDLTYSSDSACSDIDRLSFKSH